jgi:hypothetical protein
MSDVLYSVAQFESMRLEIVQLHAEIERLRAERDEAREAARDFREMYGPLFVNDIPDVEHWPWLEVSDE